MLLLYPLTLPTCSGYEVETQMNVSERTKSSIAQFIGLFSKDDISFLMGKHSISTDSVVNYDYRYGISIDSAALQAVRDADSKSIASLLEEIVRTSGYLRHKVSPRKRFDDRWNDLKKCLMLDGFKVENENIHSIEPMIEGCLIVDDLAKELESIPLADSKNIIESIRLSAECFLKSTPDYNGCLFHARIALETLIRGIALRRGYKEKVKNRLGRISSLSKSD